MKANEELEDCLPTSDLPTEILPPTKSPPNYRCFFGLCHVYKISKFILVYHAILLSSIVIIFFCESAALLVPMGVFFIASGFALWRGFATWLYPLVVYSGISTGLLVLFSAYLFFRSVVQQHVTIEEIVFSKTSTTKLSVLPTVILLANLALCAFHLWQTLVLRSAQRFLKRVQVVRKERGRADSVQTRTSEE
ncbi:hypothetical protein M3Y94_00235200 [Aphelenchoides besseyi]|nr:hypothetical protein M3Y94_00235200 [Aphelenchoides besseyi]KAI6236399.1 hypothetical protein M3Y95_00153500 [Aphelenchoides besseyi]